MPLSYDDATVDAGGSNFSMSNMVDQELPAADYDSNQGQGAFELSSLVDTLPNILSPAMGRVDRIHDFKPIVIPQTTAKLLKTNVSPFARVYPPELKPLMTEEAFLKFLDQLNEAFLASPIIQALGLAGGLMSFDPTGIIGFIGMGIQVGAGLAGGAASYARTKRYVDSVNKTTFRPWGLRVRVLATQKMMQEIGVPQSQSFTLPPLPEYDEDWDPTSPEFDPRRRRLAALGNYVADLDWDVAPLKMPDSFMGKLGAWHANYLEQSQQRKHSKSLRKVEKYDRAAARAAEKEGFDTSYESKREQARQRLENRGNTRWAQKRYKDRMAKIDRDEAKDRFKSRLAGKVGLSNGAKTQRKARWERSKHARKERMFVQRIRWVVISKFDWDSEKAEDSREDDIDVGIDEVDGGESSSDCDSVHDSESYNYGYENNGSGESERGDVRPPQASASTSWRQM